MRNARTRAAWLVVIPFFVLAEPTEAGLALGGVVGALGLALRAWSAGTIRKQERLATSGPYAFVRHPLYVGSFLIGIGLSLGGGHWAWVVVFGAFFSLAYVPTMAGERRRLTELFGDRYLEYVAHVPAVFPRLTPYRPRSADAVGGFSWKRYGEHREWEALLGAAAAWGILTAKLWLV